MLVSRGGLRCFEVFEGDNVPGVLDPNGEHLLLPLVQVSCFFKLKVFEELLKCVKQKTTQDAHSRSESTLLSNGKTVLKLSVPVKIVKHKREINETVFPVFLGSETI